MCHQKQTSQNSLANLEETLADESTQNPEAVDKVVMRVEGQNEKIHTPPKDVQEDIAAVARDLEDLTMGIEDES